MSEIETSAEYVRRVLSSAPFADNAAGIPEMCALIRALQTERDSFKRIAGEVDAMLGKVAAERDALAARAEKAEGMAEALERADEFITNGVELGFIRMPDAGTPDPAHETPGIVRTALAAWRAAAAKEAPNG